MYSVHSKIQISKRTNHRHRQKPKILPNSKKKRCKCQS